MEIDAVIGWWQWAPALLAAIRFVAPNKTRSTRDSVTGEWKRAPGHFVVRLEFSEASLRVQQGLQGALGQWIGRAVKAAREKVEATFNLYLDKTPEEVERKRKRRARIWALRPRDAAEGKERARRVARAEARVTKVGERVAGGWQAAVGKRRSRRAAVSSMDSFTAL